MDETFEDIAEQQGWTETTCYGVLMDFIDNHADKAALIRYARERADEENDPHDDDGNRLTPEWKEN